MQKAVELSIWREDDLPTVEQAFAAVCVCQWLSNGFQPIYVFRYDSIRQILYILAGTNENVQIIIPPNGFWEERQ